MIRLTFFSGYSVYGTDFGAHTASNTFFRINFIGQKSLTMLSNSHTNDQNNDELEEVFDKIEEPSEDENFQKNNISNSHTNDQNNDELEEIFDQNEELSEDDIQAYAEWLGADIEKDQDLFWIAREALMAPLPDGWKIFQKKDRTQEPFYFNSKTGESLLDHPLDQHYKELFAEEKKKKLNNM